MNTLHRSLLLSGGKRLWKKNPVLTRTCCCWCTTGGYRSCSCCSWLSGRQLEKVNLTPRTRLKWISIAVVCEQDARACVVQTVERDDRGIGEWSGIAETFLAIRRVGEKNGWNRRRYWLKINVLRQFADPDGWSGETPKNHNVQDETDHDDRWIQAYISSSLDLIQPRCDWLSKYSNTIEEKQKGSKKNQSVAYPWQITHSSLGNNDLFWVLGHKIRERYSFLHFSKSFTIEGTQKFFERRRSVFEITSGTKHIQLGSYRS